MDSSSDSARDRDAELDSTKDFVGCAENVPVQQIAHDLTNLLGVILGNVDLALHDVGSDHEIAESLREIQQAARDARTLTRVLRPSGIAQPQAPAVSSKTSPQRILFIDDEEAFRLLFKRSLSRLGHEVTACSSREEALQIFDANPSSFDIVMTDMNMPGTSGVAVAEAFLERAPDLCVCLTSGDINDSQSEKARKAGILNVLPKPNSLEEFDATIRLLADSKKPRKHAADSVADRGH